MKITLFALWLALSSCCVSFGQTRPSGGQIRVLANTQSGTTYTVLSSDCGKLLSFANSSAVAVTIPQAGSGGLAAGCWMDIQNVGPGTVTLTPTTSLIDGAASVALTVNQGLRLVSTGTAYLTQRGQGSGTGSGTVTHAEGTLAPSAFVVGNGSGDIGTPLPTATMDGAGNVSIPGILTTNTSCGGCGGAVDLPAGTDPGEGAAHTFSLIAPATIATSYRWKVPSADAAGAIVSDGAATPGTLSIVGIGAGANELVQLNSTGQLPAMDGSLLTNLPSRALSVGTASSSPVTDPGGANVYELNNAGILTFNLADAAAGYQRRLRNATGVTGAITVVPYAGNSIDLAGANATVNIASAGALGDEMWLTADVAHHWYATVLSGTWAAGSAPPSCTLSGGTATTNGDHSVQTFTAGATLTVTGTCTVSYLIVGGGGAGGQGGGGAGGAKTGIFSLTTGTYPVTVGAGLPATLCGEAQPSDSGAASSLNGVVADGGGRGGCLHESGLAGASGGGAGACTSGTPGGAGTTGEGYGGGACDTTPNYAAGGGGGAEAAGQDATPGVAGAGGIGLASTITGSSVTYACGGGGGVYLSPGTGGAAGCSTAGTGSGSGAGTSATANFGGGGGGALGGAVGGDGGAGVVIVSN